MLNTDLLESPIMNSKWIRGSLPLKTIPFIPKRPIRLYVIIDFEQNVTVSILAPSHILIVSDCCVLLVASTGTIT